MARLHAAAFAPERGWHPEEFAALLAQPFTQMHSTPEGFALARSLAGESELLTLAVDPARQGRGVGAALVARWLETIGTDTAFLEVAADNAAAIALYERSGFLETGRRRAYYSRPDSAPVDAIIMKRDLTKGNTG